MSWSMTGFRESLFGQFGKLNLEPLNKFLENTKSLRETWESKEMALNRTVYP
jgi:hypothetical protein